MKVVNAAQMRNIDLITIEEIGIDGSVLMENAGVQVVQVLLKQFPDLYDKKISIVCGKGNNGGDGLVVARHLFNKKISVEVFVLAERKALSTDAGINYDIAKKTGIKINEIKTIKELNSHTSKVIKASDIIVDAILGTGITSEITGFYKEAIRLIKQTEKIVVSIDIPSGVSSDTGKVSGEQISADITVALALPKIGNLVYPAAEFTGKLETVDIGIPEKVINGQNIKIELVEKDDFSSLFTKRRVNTHKGSYGHVLIIAGSYGLGGAAAMASLAALRVGAGLVTLALPEQMSISFETGIPEVMTLPLPQTESGSLDIIARKILNKHLSGKSVILIGPGISTDPSTSKLVNNILQEELTCPVIIDADGLNCIAGKIDLIKNKSYPVIITPHPGEIARIMNITSQDVQDERIQIASTFSRDNSVFVVLKGAHTLTSTPKEEVFINTSGNPGMATAGSGDVLSGILAGIISQEGSILESLKAGVYLHGVAGDIACQKFGEKSLIAGDIIDNISPAIKQIMTTVHKMDN